VLVVVTVAFTMAFLGESRGFAAFGGGRLVMLVLVSMIVRMVCMIMMIVIVVQLIMVILRSVCDLLRNGSSSLGGNRRIGGLANRRGVGGCVVMRLVMVRLVSACRRVTGVMLVRRSLVR
jgi:hypothetical protein